MQGSASGPPLGRPRDSHEGKTGHEHHPPEPCRAVRAGRGPQRRVLPRRPGLPPGRHDPRGLQRCRVPPGGRLDQRPRPRPVPAGAERRPLWRRPVDRGPLPPGVGGRDAHRPGGPRGQARARPAPSSAPPTTARPRACTARTRTASSSRSPGSSPPRSWTRRRWRGARASADSTWRRRRPATAPTPWAESASPPARNGRARGLVRNRSGLAPRAAVSTAGCSTRDNAGRAARPPRPVRRPPERADDSHTADGTLPVAARGRPGLAEPSGPVA